MTEVAQHHDIGFMRIPQQPPIRLVERTTEIIYQPDATPEEQRLAQLQAGNAIRLERAEYCRELKAGTLPLESLFDDPRAQTMKVERLLRSFPGIGPIKTERMLHQKRVSPATEVGALTPKEKERFFADLPAYPPKPKSHNGSSKENALQALQHAQEIRLRRAQLQKLLKSQQISLLELLDDGAAANAKLGSILSALPFRPDVNERMNSYKVSATRTVSKSALRLLNEVGMSPLLRVHKLTERQRNLLLGVVAAQGFLAYPTEPAST